LEIDSGLFLSKPKPYVTEQCLYHTGWYVTLPLLYSPSPHNTKLIHDSTATYPTKPLLHVTLFYCTKTLVCHNIALRYCTLQNQSFAKQHGTKPHPYQTGQHFSWTLHNRTFLPLYDTILHLTPLHFNLTALFCTLPPLHFTSLLYNAIAFYIAALRDDNLTRHHYAPLH